MILTAAMVGCAGEFEPEVALSQIGAQSEFGKPLYAPLHLGREILTGENHTNPDKYINAKYAVLLQAGLVGYNIKEKNSWRTLVELTLTEKANSMVDKARTDDFQAQSGENDIFYVAVCDLKPQSIIALDTIAADTIKMHYVIAEHGITPFGTFLGFEDNRTHNHNRTFARSTFSWDLLPL